MLWLAVQRLAMFLSKSLDVCCRWQRHGVEHNLVHVLLCCTFAASLSDACQALMAQTYAILTALDRQVCTFLFNVGAHIIGLIVQQAGFCDT